MFSALQPYIWGIMAGLWAISLVGVGYFAMDYANAKCTSNAALIKEAATAAYDAGQKASAESIAKIDIRHETIIQPLQTTLREKLVYSNCKHDPDGLRLLNDALTNGRAIKLGDNQLPGKPGSSKR